MKFKGKLVLLKEFDYIPKEDYGKVAARDWLIGQNQICLFLQEPEVLRNDYRQCLALLDEQTVVVWYQPEWIQVLWSQESSTS